MMVRLHQKRLDIMVSAILGLFLLLGFVFRSSPVDFMNPGFPILRMDDLSQSETFHLQGAWYETPKRTTNIYDPEKVAYEMVFHLGDPSQIFPDMLGRLNPAEFSVFHDVSHFQNAEAAERALQQSYEEYRKELSEYLVPLTNVPLVNFKSQADHSILWCEQGVNEFVFSAEKVQTCYYWAVYDRYLARTRMNMWPIAGGGRQFSLALFGEVITRAEAKFFSGLKVQR